MSISSFDYLKQFIIINIFSITKFSKMFSFYSFVSRNLLLLFNMLVITNSIYDKHQSYIVKLPSYAYNHLTSINVSYNTLMYIDLTITLIRCAMILGIANEVYNESIRLEKQKKQTKKEAEPTNDKPSESEPKPCDEPDTKNE